MSFTRYAAVLIPTGLIGGLYLYDLNERPQTEQKNSFRHRIRHFVGNWQGTIEHYVNTQGKYVSGNRCFTCARIGAGDEHPDFRESDESIKSRIAYVIRLREGKDVSSDKLTASIEALKFDYKVQTQLNKEAVSSEERKRSDQLLLSSTVVGEKK